LHVLTITTNDAAVPGISVQFVHGIALSRPLLCAS
jgi:hypothetical protein